MRRIRSMIALALGTVLLVGPPALARKQREYAYSFEQVWNAALRLVRVDLRLPVTDRDQEGGYLLFDYEVSGKRYPGSLELVAQRHEALRSTLVVAQVKGMPSYVEQMLLDRLDKKLLAEFGPPAPPPKPAPSAPSTPTPGESDAGMGEAPPRE